MPAHAHEAPTWLIIGADSRIAQETAMTLQKSNYRLIRTSRRGLAGRIQLDLGGELPALPAVRDRGIALIFAAITEQTRCEADPAHARRINVEGIANVAGALLELGWSVVFMSTDAVFPAFAPPPAVDPPGSPRSEYGRQKRDAERELLRLGNRISVLRMGKVVCLGDEPWLSWIKALSENESVAVFDDYFLDPLAPRDAVAAILKVGEAGQGGTWQAGGEGPMSYFTFLSKLQLRFRLPGKVVATKKGTTQMSGYFPTRMSSDRLKATLHWRPQGMRSLKLPEGIRLTTD